MKSILTGLFCFIALHAISQDDKLKTDWANLSKYASDNKMLGTPGTKEKRVVFMGNSITEGWKMTDSIFFAGRPYIDRGISGQTTPQMLIRFRPDVIELKPAVVVILAGINDIAENNGPISLEAVLGNIVSMIQLAQANNIKLVMCSVLPANRFPWRPSILPADKVIALNKMLKDYATQNKIVYVDYYSAMVDDEKGLPKKYAEDGVHPTLEGYKLMEGLVEEGIKKVLRK
jgi:lysophospholipase L1-like esterase